ncbi:sugar kinase [Amylibacter ulvae]|uniref:Sugar kinase n=2 Tax=Paramylibacter ulvae TaxID=1651968 RepID=A0ABQ3CUU6_9RHOB|nr:ROK family transcriptional regulator [Amylibacter ulvae]GHA43889.1 sugar kinase [Amylibacter ulvae]
MMDGTKGLEITGGVNQSGVRDHNERLILSMLKHRGPMPGADIARRSGLSPQTASIILRKLEKDGILRRGDPLRGKVGKPSIPMELNPEGVFAIGLKIGRRSADLTLIDFSGQVRQQIHTTYDYALPDAIFGFLKSGLAKILDNCTAKQRGRICGIGIGTPFELWKWHDLVGDAANRFKSWRDVDFAAEVSAFTDLPVFVLNDATAACHAEHLYGRGIKYRDYAYFYIGSFVGGGVVLNGTVFEGNQGNAGALGSMRTTGPLGESQQLIDTASLHLLEARLVEAGVDPTVLWHKPQDWSTLTNYVEPWIGETAQELSKATLSICSVLDFEAIIIDGAFPSDVRDELVARVKRYIVNQDVRGLIAPNVEPGSVGENARAIGAATGPIFRQFLLNTNAGLSA